jgi:hypothetical protein
MYQRGEIDHWTDAELVELWRERSAMRETDPTKTGACQAADYAAGQEIRRWLTRPLPKEIQDGMRAKFKTRQ